VAARSLSCARRFGPGAVPWQSHAFGTNNTACGTGDVFWMGSALLRINASQAHYRAAIPYELNYFKGLYASELPKAERYWSCGPASSSLTCGPSFDDGRSDGFKASGAT
jgi:hypothetical protein